VTNFNCANMRKFLLFLSLFISKVAFSQVSDNFSDGDFTQNPAWQPDISTNFVVANGQLQSNSTTASSNFNISTANTKALNCTWEFDCNLKFATSGTNYVDIYLISNVADLKSTNINGYFVRMGDTQDDVCSYKRSGITSSSVKLIDGRDGAVFSSSNNNFKFKISRESNGAFTLERDSTGTGNSFYTEGTVTDNTFITTTAFGFFIQQSTASFFQKHFFDNIVIADYVPDVTPPVFNSVSTTDGKAIKLTFNEAVNPTDAAIASHYNIAPGNITPTSVTASGAIVTLNLTTALAVGNYTVKVNSIKDIKGNTAASQSKGFTYKIPYTAVYNDIVINELLPDPSPEVGLPGAEFVELWNKSTEDIALAGFKYSDPSTTYTFSGDSIKAGQYIILCPIAEMDNFTKYGKVIGLSAWPTLNNASDNIKLLNQNGATIADLSYIDTWYKNSTKKNGGWTLELIDPLSTCKPSQNYSASINPDGGTPGKANSIYLSNKTTDPLLLVNAVFLSGDTISLTFNRGLDSLQATLPSHYSINNGAGAPNKVNPIAPSFSTVNLAYPQALTRNQNYTITVSGLTDCGSGVITSQTFNFPYPAVIAKNDVLINEVLFNPRPNGVDYVEVYNNSDKILDFKDLKIGTVNDTDSVTSVKVVSATSLPILPKTYWVISSNPDTVKTQYNTSNPNNFIKVSTMPSYSDDNGKVVILTIVGKDTTRIDQLNYDKKMHFSLLKDLNGVSLERSSFTQSTNAPGNFLSAAASLGYGTPADKNSQVSEDATITTEEISLVTPTFSPDNDGFEDILRIKYHFAQTNKVANVSIYSDQGRLIKKLVRNETLATEGQLIWDGLDDTNQKVKMGIYIIYVELFDLGGSVKKYKKTAVLAGKLD
jgi:hypothetical protein